LPVAVLTASVPQRHDDCRPDTVSTTALRRTKGSCCSGCRPCAAMLASPRAAMVTSHHVVVLAGHRAVVIVAHYATVLL
jgi:hypothetical protein